MKRFLSFLLKLVLLLTVIFIIFFYWASSSTKEKSSYAELLQNEYSTIKDNDSIYSIVTYNIGYLSGMTNNRAVAKSKELFDTNLKKVIKEIKNVNPDIIAFQEIDYNASRSYEVNQEEEIAKLGYNYVARGVNWDERYLPFPYWPPSMHFGKVVSGQSILSKYPLKEYKRVVLERVSDNPFYRDAFYLDRLLQITKVVIEDKEVVLMNVHLEAFDKKTRGNQLQKVIQLFKKYSKTNPTILLGDFNSDPKYKNALIKQVFKIPNIGNAAFLDTKYEMTFDTKDPFERLDYIFYTKNTIEYIKGKVLKEFGQSSDHLPVEMSFKLR
ncbi:endonuclease/exonuclease/phosphatase [Tenacibaculum sp. E3R01]|uniref:endonuclease/exonuclease/phosphatase family protein n=1 Tax=unclassified Tenacibaculum TaxID=2635139 RepID=UPI00089BF93A|nr:MULTISPECIES: endonuclease/exonuclease/phosphatase family protein [unclassified Tenacibaculum]RBW57168.1 endonuclease/exonuclease/phosphatase [Tenacibaculum sp. E3R01]SEE28101.1 Metal-dependent hydrolase, endonuclease/exonuclease/phosphatase family [Tenacibaculum sp. MAR_2010_89]